MTNPDATKRRDSYTDPQPPTHRVPILVQLGVVAVTGMVLLAVAVAEFNKAD